VRHRAAHRLIDVRQVQNARNVQTRLAIQPTHLKVRIWHQARLVVQRGDARIVQQDRVHGQFAPDPHRRVDQRLDIPQHYRRTLIFVREQREQRQQQQDEVANFLLSLNDPLDNHFAGFLVEDVGIGADGRVERPKVVVVQIFVKLFGRDVLLFGHDLDFLQISYVFLEYFTLGGHRRPDGLPGQIVFSEESRNFHCKSMSWSIFIADSKKIDNFLR
jgi:hypothetical protein